MSSLRIEYDVIPPTSNKLYFRGTILTTIARKYAEQFSYEVTRKYLHEVQRLDPKGIYSIYVQFFFNRLTNASFEDPKVPQKDRAKSRYKKMDLSNRFKLLEDCVRDIIGIDDCQTFSATLEKHQTDGPEKIVIFIQQVNPKDFGLP